ncbi:hypothetical protein CLV24_115104 [Pontibacter ummariensis]|uniref:Uncharacterized protein n=1 Tax=Pontibacter ummariensis TaxID=1610492 RepID=A0A239I270_9BACT|nr:hypothetical protein [Pontibacter ummariensis]PRY10187.1 hypothetical protein CLV24_115104 [Pontibacter ummariensis]SNS87695.1 hypothetical protein SAMN06296052_115104 [Pontibacter ummariensis]
MKLNVHEKPYLPEGRHVVKITEVDEGRSENKDVPFINCRFENEDGFINQRFYLSEPGQPILAAFLKAAGIEKTEVDSKELKGKVLSIEVEERSYEDAEGKEKKIKQATHFEEAGEADTSDRF